jgi:hypothetical protein
MTTVDELAGKYTGVVDRVIAVIPYKRIAVWKEFFFNPSATVAKNIDSIVDRVKDLYVLYVITGLLMLIGALPSMAISAVSSLGVAALSYGIIAALVVALYIILPVIELAYALLEFLVAKALGSTAEFKAHFNASILPALSVFTVLLPLTILEIPFRWLQAIPGVSICAGIIMIVFNIPAALAGLYSLYLKYLAFKEVHKLSTLRTLAIEFAPIIIIFVLMIVLVIVFYAAFAALLVGAMMKAPLIK